MAQITVAILTAAVAAARVYDVPPSLILAVIEVESNFESFVLGDYKDGVPHSWGLMQLHDAGGAGSFYPAGFLLDTNNNVMLGTRYLAACLKAFPDDLKTGVSAYNQGITGAKQRGWEFNKPYVDKVLEAQKKYLVFDQILR